MVRAFLVTKKSEYYKDLQKYIERVNLQKKQIREFNEVNGIESEMCGISGDGMCNCSFDDFDKGGIRLYIVPTASYHHNAEVKQKHPYAALPPLCSTFSHK